MYIEQFVATLIVDDGVCRGVVAYDMIRGGFEAFTADAVVIATGGAGRIYSNTTNAIISTGGGMAMAYHAGVPLKDMEFIQFHPTGLLTTNILMTEGAPRRGRLPRQRPGRALHGASTRPRPWSWRRATSPPAPSRPRSTRAGASTARTTSTSTCGTSAAEKILERLPGIRDLAIHFEGVDPIEEPIPIVPSQHYTMGGIDTDVDGRTAHAGLLRRRRVRLRERARRQPARRQLAARDHRLRAPRRRGRGAPTSRAAARRRPPPPRGRRAPSPPWRPRVDELAARGTDGEDAYAIRAEMTATMKEHFGVFRDEPTMQRRASRSCSRSRSAAATSACATPAASSTST